MKILSSDNMTNSMEQNLAMKLIKNKKVDKKDDSPTLAETIANIKINAIKTLTTGKTALKLEELNKQKVTPDILEKVIKELNIKDTNKDGKISLEELKDQLKDIKDKNNDGKVTPQEEKAHKEKKTLGMVKKIITELKKDDDFKEIKPEQFKGISKMVNKELIEPKEAESINKFLNN